MEIYSVIGIMSGTSLDGLDLAYCTFYKDEKWNYKIVGATTFKYTTEMYNDLKNASNLSAFQFIKLHRDYGFFIGDCVNQYLKDNRFQSPDLISSHGHTIFHKPDEKINFQIGDANAIAARTGVTTISDFRSLNIAIGGQGAPLVPIGDDLLFDNFDYCLNLGGFANISYSENEQRKAYDICSFNFIANYYANQAGFEFDNEGEIGRSGKINFDLLNELNDIEFYKIKPPKSLGVEWLNEFFFPIINKYNISLNDKLRTFYEHTAIQISKINESENQKSIFVTGGGAYNKYFIELLKQKSNFEIIIPDNQIVEYKEALIFAFLGVLRFRNEINCLASATGSEFDNCTGIIVHIK